MTVSIGRLELLCLAVFAFNGAAAGAARHLEAHELVQGCFDVFIAFAFAIVEGYQLFYLIRWSFRKIFA